jgi:hypothetical protein
MLIFFLFEGLAKCINSLGALLETSQDITKITERIIASKNSVDEILAWLSSSNDVDDEWVEHTSLTWRLLQLKLIVVRHIDLDVESRKRILGHITEVR